MDNTMRETKIRQQTLAYIMLWAIQKTPDLERLKNESEYTKAFYEGRWDIMRELKALISKKSDVSFLRDIFEKSMEGIAGTKEWKDGYKYGAKEVIEKVAEALKGDDVK